MINSIIYLLKSQKPDKKFKVLVGLKTIHFGSKGMSDYTLNKDPQRKHLYIKRHRRRENWNKSGIQTAGFWSRWLLWNKPTLDESIKDIEKR
jgi:hypothetical protein